MAYSTNAQVAEEFNISAFSASTNPTSTTVDRWIAEADQLIDSKVGLKYEVPVTNASDLLIMRKISILLVSERVRRRIGRVTNDNSLNKEFGSGTHGIAMKMLNEIIEGKIKLAGSTLANSKAGVSSFNVDCDEEATYEKNVDQW